MGDEEKQKCRQLMRAVEGFRGVRVLTCAVMNNHFQLLVGVPGWEAVGDEEFFRRMGWLYGKRWVREVARALAGEDARAEALKARFTYRMGDVREFMKTLKLIVT